MSSFDEKELNKLMKLSRIDCTEEEKKKLVESLRKIIQHIDHLQTVKTEGVAPCTHILETLINVMREDIVGKTLSREAFLANAPAHVGGMIRVPPVIKFE
jgi:aspartyl-tRNA(Asn)/glutamyl-tRNA(Gln) amidotransferase subunit C